MWIIDAFTSPQRGFRQLAPLSSLCYEGNDFITSFTVLETSFLPPIRIAIWGRDMRVVVLTGSLFLVNVVGLLYGNGFSVSILATGCSDPSIDRSQQGKFAKPVSQRHIL